MPDQVLFPAEAFRAIQASEGVVWELVLVLFPNVPVEFAPRTEGNHAFFAKNRGVNGRGGLLVFSGVLRQELVRIDHLSGNKWLKKNYDSFGLNGI